MAQRLQFRKDFGNDAHTRTDGLPVQLPSERLPEHFLVEVFANLFHSRVVEASIEQRICGGMLLCKADKPFDGRSDQLVE